MLWLQSERLRNPSDLQTIDHCCPWGGKTTKKVSVSVPPPKDLILVLETGAVLAQGIVEDRSELASSRHLWV